MNNNILALVFLVAGTMLLATTALTALTTLVPAAYAEDNSAEDDSLSQQNNCDENDISGDNPQFRDVCENTATNNAND